MTAFHLLGNRVERQIQFVEHMKISVFNSGSIRIYGVINMIAFSIMMWFVSIILVLLSISLLRGNYASMHGKVLDSTDDKEGYAKALGKPILLLEVGFAVVGITAVVLPQKYSILISVAFIVIILMIAVIWGGKILNKFS